MCVNAPDGFRMKQFLRPPQDYLTGYAIMVAIDHLQLVPDGRQMGLKIEMSS